MPERRRQVHARAATLWPLTVSICRQQKAYMDSASIGAIGYSAVSQTAPLIKRLLLGA